MNTIQWDGQRISRPGIYAGIPIDDYHRGDVCDGPSISSSGLRLIWSKSPKHFWNVSALNPMRDDSGDDRKEFIIGRAAHHLVCGEIGFGDHYVIRPDKAPDGRDWHGANKSCIKWLDEQKKLGLSVLTPEMAESIRGMAISLGENSLMRAGILSGLVERSMFWRDKRTNVWLKARPDVIATASGDFADLKTTTSALHRDLQRALVDYGYHQQGALVLDGARELGLEASSFTLVWIEKRRPHCVRVQTIIDDDLARGSKMNRVAIDIFASCIKARHWPGPGDDRADAEYIQLPDWAREQIDTRLKYELAEVA